MPTLQAACPGQASAPLFLGDLVQDPIGFELSDFDAPLWLDAPAACEPAGHESGARRASDRSLQAVPASM